MSPDRKKPTPNERLLEETLRQLESPHAPPRWEAPPADVVERAFSRPERAAPPVPARRKRVAWEPLDVRSEALGAPGATRMAAEGFPEGEVAIVVVPPSGHGRWEIRGQVWLRGDAALTDVRVVLVDGEHVVADVAPGDDGAFAFEEAVAGGWELEIHLPTGRAVALKDPQS